MVTSKQRSIQLEKKEELAGWELLSFTLCKCKFCSWWCTGGQRKYFDAFLVLQEEVISASLLLRVLHRVQLVDARPKVIWITAEGNVQQLEEAVHAGK